jgi:hypothetical protein
VTGNGFEDYDVLAQSDMADAEPDTDLQVGAFVDPDLSLSPVAPLGFAKGRIFFAMPEGEIRDELAAKIGGMLRTDIFACQAGAAFLANWRDKEGKFQRELAAIWFVRQCRLAGFWDEARVQRSLGVWLGDAGAVVLHKGDEVWTFSPPEPEADGAKPAKKRAKGSLRKQTVAETLRDRRGPIYRLHAPMPAPASPCDASHGAWVREKLDLWRFDPIGGEGLTGADAALGFIGAGMLGAVAPFRGHMLVTAPAGSGKTSLAFYLQAVMSAVCGDVIDQFTDAGLRSDLAGMARPVILDEAEASNGINGPGLIERALDLLRRMATGSGSTRKQGSINGAAVTQTAVGAAWLAGTQTPRLAPADATRFVEIRLRPLRSAPAAKSPIPPGGAEADRPSATDADLELNKDRARAMSPALLGRVLGQAWRYRADVAAIKAALARSGESPRTADLIATLAAGRRLMLFDDPLDQAGAEEEARFWRPLLLQREQASNETNTGAEALMHLFAADSGLNYHDRRLTLIEPIASMARNVDEDGLPLGPDRRRKLRTLLAVHGLKVEHMEGAPWLLVANAHPALERVFRPTVWRDWRRSLAELDGLGEAYATRPTSNSQRFGDGVKQRALCIPLTPWLEDTASRGTVGTGGVPQTVPGQDYDWVG